MTHVDYGEKKPSDTDGFQRAQIGEDEIGPVDGEDLGDNEDDCQLETVDGELVGTGGQAGIWMSERTFDRIGALTRGG